MISIFYTFNITNILFLLLQFYDVKCNPKAPEEEWVLLTKPQINRTNTLHSPPLPRTFAPVYDEISNVKFDNLFPSDPLLYDHATEFTTAKPGHRSIFNTFSSDTTLKGDQIKYADVTQCLWCFTDRGFMADESCYSGKTPAKLRCSSNEICYTELHPQYIRRGCFKPNKMNKTFVCNCPLCNDKTVYQSVYYEYKRISDWDYHNKRIQIPIVGIQLTCKTCETRGRNALIDDKCRFGTVDDYVVCGRNQVCYVNHDEETDFVTRGCTNTPAYNSMFYLCNNSLCNSKPFNIPKIRSEKLLLNEMSHNRSHTKSTGVAINNLTVFKILLILKAVFTIVKLYLSLP